MLAAATVCVLTCQMLVTDPPLSYPGETVTVRAVEEASRRPLAGWVIELVAPSGERKSLGATGAAGELTFAPAGTGVFELHARRPGETVLVIGLHRVLERPRRWLYAIFCVPVGLLLLWWSVRGFRGESRARASLPRS